MRGIRARNLARDVGFVVIRVASGGVRRNGSSILEVGPDASPDAIATEACRRLAERLYGEPATESVVAELAESHGFAYEPPARGSGLFFKVG